MTRSPTQLTIRAGAFAHRSRRARGVPSQRDQPDSNRRSSNCARGGPREHSGGGRRYGRSVRDVERAPPGHRSWVRGTVSRACNPSAAKGCSTWPLSWRSITMLISREPKPARLLRLGAGPWLSFQSRTRVRPCCVRVTDQDSKTRPDELERLPCLLALVASSCTAMLSPKVGSGSRKTLGPLNEMRSRNGASSVLKSSLSEVDFQPPSVMRRWAFASARTRASYLATRSATPREFLAVCENSASSWEKRLPER